VKPPWIYHTLKLKIVAHNERKKLKIVAPHDSRRSARCTPSRSQFDSLKLPIKLLPPSLSDIQSISNIARNYVFCSWHGDLAFFNVQLKASYDFNTGAQWVSTLTALTLSNGFRLSIFLFLGWDWERFESCWQMLLAIPCSMLELESLCLRF
jgi:hypothetical protein